MLIPLNGTPYSLGDAIINAVTGEIYKLQDRAELLRSTGKMSVETLKSFYGQKRFEQVAESNALEGSTLSVGETELAILKGITITGHNPAYVRDAVSLDNALKRIAEMAKLSAPTDIEQLHEIHALILGDREGAGKFRSVPVRITGSKHTPKPTWKEIMDQMEKWENWSKMYKNISPIIRASVMHAWLTHIHPFIDGNGRTARAISNLELIRSGLPPIIIRKIERDRYLDALSQSDSGGDIAPFIDLILTRSEDALLGLEKAAAKHDEYDPLKEKILKGQRQRLEIWNTSVSLLQAMLYERLANAFEKYNAEVSVKHFIEALSLDDYIELCSGNSVSKSWAFRCKIEVVGLSPVERLAWIGYRSLGMKNATQESGGPSLYWSKPLQSYPPWQQCYTDAPGPSEMTTRHGYGDKWFIHDPVQSVIVEASTSAVVDRIVQGFKDLVK